MKVISNIIMLVRMAMIHPGLVTLAWNLKRTKRTFLSYAALYSLVESFKLEMERRDAEQIHVAEFGVGRGGSAILLAWLVERYGGKLTLYDMFGRIPAPTEIDGVRANQRYDDILTKESSEYYGNIKDLLSVITRELYEVCNPTRIEFVQGKYEETLVDAQDTRSFNLVHIDCDWYESSMAVYKYLQSRVSPEAIIQVDDYSNWDGSKKAFYDAGWLSQYRTNLVDGVLVIDTGNNKVDLFDNDGYC